MHYLRALDLLHDNLRPANYVEIGCRKGISLSRAKCPAIAIDPEFEIICPLTAPTRLFREKSDDFFANRNLGALLGGTVDLAFIDGMHNAEFVLRDFINLERFSNENTVIVIDDVLPEDIAWTTRERQTQAWTGDVYKTIPFLRTSRPDLHINVFDIEIKGLAIVHNLNPNDRSLSDSLDSHEAFLAGPDSALGSIDDIRKALAPRATIEFDSFIADLRKN
jgi:hypothetical protein